MNTLTAQFAETFETEAAQAAPTTYEKWVARLEQILGFDLDGDQTRDGYSLDLAVCLYQRNLPPCLAAEDVRQSKRAADARRTA